MEEVSEQNQAMASLGTHPYGDLLELPEPLKADLVHVLRAAVELEREFEAVVVGGQDHQINWLNAKRRRWADDLEKLVHEFRSSGLPLQTQALV